MAWASSLCDFSIEIVLDHHYLLGSIWVGFENALDGSVGSLTLTSSDVPSVANHKLEVIVTVNAGTQILVVVLEFFNCDNLVSLMRLPNSHEIRENLISCLTSTLEVGVEAHIVSNSNIINSDLATSILIKDTVGLMDHVETALVKTAADGAQKLIERQLSILIGVEMFNDLSDFDLGEVQTIVSHRVLELDRAERSITIAVHSSEHGAKTTKSVGTSLLA